MDEQANLCDPAAERAVLAGIFTYGTDAWLDASDLLGPEAFAVDSNQHIWACLRHLFSDAPRGAVDFPSLLAAAKAVGLDGVFAKPEEVQHVRAVMGFPVERSTVREMAVIVKKLEVARRGYRQLMVAQDRLLGVTGQESIDQIVGLAEGPIQDWTASLAQAGGDGPKAVGDGLAEYADRLASHPQEVVGIPSGFREYDRAIGGGFRPGTVNVIGARPKTGKSLFATNVACRVSSGRYYDWPKKHPASLGVPVLQLDTEMTREDQWVRQLALVSGVSIEDIETGKYAADPRKKMLVACAIENLKSWPYDFLSIAGQPFEETVATMRRWLAKRQLLNDDGTAKPCLIIFDYLKLMSDDGLKSSKLAEFQLLGFMMTGLHNFAVRYRVPILTFVQLNREGIDTEDTSVASGSDRIVWLCSNFSIYKKKTDEEVAEAGGDARKYNRKLIPIVARHGAGLDDGDYVNIQSLGATATLLEGPTRNVMAAGPLGSPSARPKGFIVNDTADQDEVPFSA